MEGSSHKPPRLKRMKALLDDPSVRSWRAIMAAFQIIYYQLERLLMQDGFHVSRFQILFFLYFEGPLSAVSISRKLLVTRGNTSTFIRRLQKDKVIQVCPTSPSMARPLFRLTPKAEAEFEELFPRHVGRVKKRVPKLSASTLKELQKIIDKNRSAALD